MSQDQMQIGQSKGHNYATSYFMVMEMFTLPISILEYSVKTSMALLFKMDQGQI